MYLNFDNPKEKRYLQVYHYYRELIEEGKLKAKDKMPSIRRCADELKISRTTVESAYLQLAADGYILSRPQSGYYVTGFGTKPVSQKQSPAFSESRVLYSFSHSGTDRESFRFDLWRRYIKSALRQDERLLEYGNPQGEWELRQVLADYVRQQRNVICSPHQIVIGAGTQSLLHILCPLLKSKKTVSFPNPSFVQGSSVFADYGFDIHYRDKDADIIYVSPAHMTKWGEIMPVSRRLELISHAAAHGSLIIEDDYENEFVYMQRPTPSLQSLAGGEHVVYMGSFSRLLLPSIRLSFMVLPSDLCSHYRQIRDHYNQTASKMEQIALCQFIRDGHLSSQTKRLNRYYAGKLKKLTSSLKDTFGENVSLKTGAAGTSTALTLPCPVSGKEFLEKAKKHKIQVELLSESKGYVTLILSCSAMPSETFPAACRELYLVWKSCFSSDF